MLSSFYLSLSFVSFVFYYFVTGFLFLFIFCYNFRYVGFENSVNENCLKFLNFFIIPRKFVGGVYNI